MSKTEIKVLFIITTIAFAVLKKMVEDCADKQDLESQITECFAVALVLMWTWLLAVLVYYSIFG